MANTREISAGERVINQPAVEGLRVDFNRTAVEGAYANQAAAILNTPGESNWKLYRDGGGNVSLDMGDGRLIPASGGPNQQANELCFRRQFAPQPPMGMHVRVNPNVRIDELVRLTNVPQYGWQGAEIEAVVGPEGVRAKEVFHLTIGSGGAVPFYGQLGQNYGYGVNSAIRRLEAHGPNPFNSYAGGNYYRWQDSRYTGTQAIDGGVPGGVDGWRRQDSCYTGTQAIDGGVPGGVDGWRRQDSCYTGTQAIDGGVPGGVDGWRRQDSGTTQGGSAYRHYQVPAFTRPQDSAPTSYSNYGQSAIPEGFHPAPEATTSTSLNYQPAQEPVRHHHRHPAPPDVSFSEQVQARLMPSTNTSVDATYKTTTDNNSFKGNDL